MELEIIILTEVIKKKEMPYDITYMESKIWHNWTIMKHKQTNRCIDQTCGYRGGGGVVEECSGSLSSADANYYI